LYLFKNITEFLTSIILNHALKKYIFYSNEFNIYLLDVTVIIPFVIFSFTIPLNAQLFKSK